MIPSSWWSMCRWICPVSSVTCWLYCYVCGLSAGMVSVIEEEDEPEEKDSFNWLHEHARLEELARRNTLCLPHLRSVYPLEVFSANDDVAALSKDISTSAVTAGQSRETSRSSGIEGHVTDFSRSTVVEGQPKETSRSRLSSTLSLPPQSELSNQENVAKHKVNTSVCVCCL